MEDSGSFFYFLLKSSIFWVVYKNSVKLIIIAILILVLLVLNLLLGSVKIPALDTLDILFGDRSNEIFSNIILKSRLPQALVAIMAGAGLAVSGLQMQTVFRNPLAGNPFAFHRRSAKK